MEDDRRSGGAGRVGGEIPRIDGFELVARIGSGIRSEIWRARTWGGAEVALKIFHRSLSSRPDFVTTFEKETAALVAASHPNILGVLERGRAGDRFYVSSEYMRKGSLREITLAGPVAAPLALRITQEVCDALEHAHRRGLVHRNLVQENVFIDGSDRVRVADWGLSLLHGTSRNELAPGDARTDVYAAGMLLHELTSGKRPAPPFVPLTRKVPALPPRVDELLGRAFSPRPQDRFGRANELSMALRLASATPEEAPASSTAEGATLSSKDKVVTVTVAADATPTRAKTSLARLGAMIDAGGPWRLAYNLCALRDMDDGLTELIRGVHVRYQRKLERVAFCSPRALVRGSVLELAKSASSRIPWKVFAAPEPMRRWMEEDVAT